MLAVMPMTIVTMVVTKYQGHVANYALIGTLGAQLADVYQCGNGAMGKVIVA